MSINLIMTKASSPTGAFAYQTCSERLANKLGKIVQVKRDFPKHAEKLIQKGEVTIRTTKDTFHIKVI
jgi:hypothetical protein